MKQATDKPSLAAHLAVRIGGPLVTFGPARPGKLVRGGK
jgi:hypothetical protein